MGAMLTINDYEVEVIANKLAKQVVRDALFKVAEKIRDRIKKYDPVSVTPTIFMFNMVADELESAAKEMSK